MKTKHLLSLLFVLFPFNSSLAQVPSWQWAKSAIGHQNDQASAVTTDGSGNIYVAGYFASDSIIFGSHTVYNNGIGNQDMFLVKYDVSGNVLWAKSEGGSADDKPYSVSTDAAGNVYVTGSFYSPTITLGTNTYTNAGTVADIFIVKYDNTGNVVWSTSQGGPSVEIPFALYVESAGSIVVAGRFSSTSVIFGTDTLLQAGSMDVFVVKYDAAGNVVWARGAGSGSNDEAYALSEDGSGNIYVAGYFNQNAHFGTFTLTSSGVADMFLAKVDPNGTFLWAKKAAGTGDDRITALSTDVSGNSYVAGYFVSDTLTAGTFILPSHGADNSILAKFDNSGNVSWAKSINGDSKALSLARKNNRLFVCGGFSADTLIFGSSTLVIDGSTDFYMAGCDISGNSAWALKQSSGGSSSENATAITIDASGSLVLAGYFKSNPIAFGPSVLSNTVSSFDMFVARTGPVATGIEELKEANTFLLYPNPAAGNVVLKTSKHFESLEIFEVTGRRFFFLEENLSSQNENISLPVLQPGIYLVRMLSENNACTQKLVISGE